MPYGDALLVWWHVFERRRRPVLVGMGSAAMDAVLGVSSEEED